MLLFFSFRIESYEILFLLDALVQWHKAVVLYIHTYTRVYIHMLVIHVLQVYLLTVLALLRFLGKVQIPRSRPEALQDVVEETTPAGACCGWEGFRGNPKWSLRHVDIYNMSLKIHIWVAFRRSADFFSHMIEWCFRKISFVCGKMTQGGGLRWKVTSSMFSNSRFCPATWKTHLLPTQFVDIWQT